MKNNNLKTFINIMAENNDSLLYMPIDNDNDPLLYMSSDNDHEILSWENLRGN